MLVVQKIKAVCDINSLIDKNVHITDKDTIYSLNKLANDRKYPMCMQP